MSDHSFERPTDRALALAEIESLAKTLRSASEVHLYSKQAWRRDRTIGWILTVVIFAVLGWGTYFQYTSDAELRQNLYAGCVDRNHQTQALRDLYLSLTTNSKAALAKSPTGPLADPVVRATNIANMTLLDNAANALKPLDCSGMR